MYISINWIKDFVDLDGIDVEKLIYKFTMSTAEVEGITKFFDMTENEFRRTYLNLDITILNTIKYD